jgi:O-antigen ligase
MIVNILVGLIILLVLALFVLLGLSRHRSIVAYLLIISLLLGPRIPVGRLTDMQRLDLRIDDLLILLMFLIAGSLLLLKRIKIDYPAYMHFLVAFILVSLVSSIYAVAYYRFPLDNTFLFWLKEMEYISLCFSIPFFITKKQNLVTMLKVICIGMAINIGWLFFQIITNTKGQLINLVDYAPSYGFTLVGDFPAFQVASIYSYALILFTILFFLYRKKYLLLVLMLGSFIGLFASLSRSFIASTIVAITLMFFYFIYRKKTMPIKTLAIIMIISVLIIMVGVWTFLYLKSHEFPIFRLETTETRYALTEVREKGIWEPLWHSFLENPILGYGKGGVGELLYNFDEAHNYYLRLLIETGILGTSFFILFLIYLTKTSFRLLNHAQTKENYIIALNMLMVTLVLCIVSFGQDGFYSSKLAIPFYINVGLINVIYMKYSREKSLKYSVKRIECHAY